MVYRAALFDLDGVLLDSGEALYRVYADAIEKFGLPFRSREDLLVPCGMTDYEWIRVLAPGYPEKTIRQAAAWCAASYASTYLEKFARPAQGALEALRFFRQKGLLLALVTNQTRRQVQTSQRLLGFSDFQAVVSMDDVVRPKPDPEPVRKALLKLGVFPDEAFFVGDTAADLFAGKAAGIDTFILSAPWNLSLQASKLNNFKELVNLIP